MHLKNLGFLLFVGLWLCVRPESEVKIVRYNGNKPVVFNSVGFMRNTLRATSLFNLDSSQMLIKITELKLKYLEVMKKETCRNDINCAEHSSLKFKEVHELCKDISNLSQTSSIIKKPTRIRKFAGLFLTPIVALNTIGLIALAVEVKNINVAMKSLQGDAGKHKEILHRITDQVELLLEMNQNLTGRVEIIEHRLDNIGILLNIDHDLETVRNLALYYIM